MSAFVERLVEAAKHAGVEPTQAGIAESLGLSKQTVWRWFREGIEPNAENCFEIARKWGVDAEWLKSGDGDMLPRLAAELPQDERDLLKDYRLAAPKVRKIIRGMARAARKSIVTIAAAIPPFLAPQQGDASMQHNLFSVAHNDAKCMNLIHIMCAWLRRWWLGRAIMIS